MSVTKMKRQPKKRRRPRGFGTVYRKGRYWWIAYRAPDGQRIAESSESERKGDAERLLQQRVGARENNLPVIPKAEALTFAEAAQDMLNAHVAKHGPDTVGDIQRRLTKHLTPYFGGRRLVGITAATVVGYVAKRQEDQVVTRKQRIITNGDGVEEIVPAQTRPVSGAEINRELAILRRMFTVAIKSGRLALKPHIAMLGEAPARSGFFEAEQLDAVLRHLPAEIQPVIRFGHITGWRIRSEVLPLEWRQVDFDAGEVRLDPGTTKNREGRVFPMTAALRELLETQHVAHERLKKAGQICPLVFHRLVPDRRLGQDVPTCITSFRKAWAKAVRAAGVPGRIPHDLRRTAVRNLVRAGIPERVAMQMTGHKTRSVFERYNIVSGGDLKDAARRLDAAKPTRAKRGNGRSGAVA